MESPMLVWTLVLLSFVMSTIAALAYLSLRTSVRQMEHQLQWFPAYSEGLGYYESQQLRETDYVIYDAARELNLTLTPAARAMLRIPLVELMSNGEVEFVQVQQTLLDIMKTIRDDPDPRDTYGNVRSAVSVIRGFARRFCNIPPFCDRREG